VSKPGSTIPHDFSQEVLEGATKLKVDSSLRDSRSCSPPTQWSVWQFETCMMGGFAAAMAVALWRKRRLQLLS
jgi:hypothetical protein